MTTVCLIVQSPDYVLPSPLIHSWQNTRDKKRGSRDATPLYCEHSKGNPCQALRNSSCLVLLAAPPLLISTTRGQNHTWNFRRGKISKLKFYLSSHIEFFYGESTPASNSIRNKNVSMEQWCYLSLGAFFRRENYYNIQWLILSRQLSTKRFSQIFL